MFRRRKNGFKLAGKERKYVSLQSEFKKRIIKKALSFACRLWGGVDFQFSFPKNYTMESFIEHIFVLLGAFALVILVYSLIFKYSPIRSFPSMTTLPVRSRLGNSGSYISHRREYCFVSLLRPRITTTFSKFLWVWNICAFDSSDSAFVPDMLDFQVWKECLVSLPSQT